MWFDNAAPSPVAAGLPSAMTANPGLNSSGSATAAGALHAAAHSAASTLARAAGARSAAALSDSQEGKEDPLASASEDFEALSLGVLFTTMLIFLGGTFFMTNRTRIPLPYTVVLLIYGIFVGAIATLIAPGVATALGSIPPELLFYIFLPVLIFEGSFAMNVHALRRVFFPTLLLATAGILINTAILGGAVKLVYMDWSWYAAFLLGSLLSATDPVAVVALLKSLRVEKHITAMVDGEAVMNDGTAIIVFSLLMPAAKVGALTDPVWLILLRCVRLCLLPIAIGPTFGFLQSFWLRRARSGLTRACVTVSVTYVSYYIAAHWIGASGVLTLFFQGVFMSYYCPSLFPGVEGGNLISSTWELLVHLGNTMLFSLVGVILVADVAPTIEPVDILIIVGLYVAMLAARLVMLEVLLPVMNLFSYKMTQKTVLLLTHAGLRGGVAATLALAVQQGGLKEGIPILKVTCGVVLLTLLVNATTAARVVGMLGFKSKEEYRVRQVQYAMDSLNNAEEKALERVKRDTKYRNANWLSVERYINKWVRNPFTGQEIVPDESDDAVINRLLMTAFKTALWRQRDEQVISETVVMQLGQMITEKIEKAELFNISEMQLYHRGRSHVAAVTTAADVVVADSASGGPQQPQWQQSQQPTHPASVKGRATGKLALSRSVSIVVDSHARKRAEDDHARTVGAARDDDEPEEEELPPFAAAGAGSPIRAGPASVASFVTRQSSWDAALPASTSPPPPPESPVFSPQAGANFPQNEGGGATEEDTDATVEALMGRLLPAWVVLAERFLVRKGYFTSAHRRAQENAFMSLLAVVKCLSVMSADRYRYLKTPEQARRIEGWFSRQLQDGNAAIRFFYNHFPEATNTVSSSRAVISIVNELHAEVETLHAEHGIGMRMKELLEGMTDDIRENIPDRWENDEPRKEMDLVTQAVAATTLGKGLRKAEIKAIATMALVKTFSEDDIITLPENAFLIVVFGSLHALHSRWTTISEKEWSESFGDTVGLETLLLPAELCKDRQRQWRVISTEATAIMISFNSIKPFLMERSMRSVKALWRAAAVEVVLPLLEAMITPQAAKSESSREQLTNVVMQGIPLIGPEDCARFDYSSQFHLCFYLRGSDATGMFNGHTPPCYISAFYANQLIWRDPNVVLYAVPMNISDSGYVPWNFRGAAASSAAGGSAAPSAAGSEAGDSPAPEDATAPSHAEAIVDISLEPSAAARSTYADAASILSSVLQGIVPSEIEHSIGGGSGRRGRRAPRGGGGGDAGHGSFISSALSRATSEGFLQHADSTANRFGSTSVSGGDFVSFRSFAVDGPVCVLQRLSDFVTPIPYVNTLFAQYAARLEMLCMAALRYMRYPHDMRHVMHARYTAEASLQFLLSFAVELSLLRRAVKAIAARDATMTTTSAAPSEAPAGERDSRAKLRVLDSEGRGEEIDADFQCKVCAWSRQAASTKKYHLKTLILEMNTFANRRFKKYAEALKYAVEMRPKLAEVESVEGMQRLLRSLEQ